MSVITRTEANIRYIRSFLSKKYLLMFNVKFILKIRVKMKYLLCIFVLKQANNRIFAIFVSVLLLSLVSYFKWFRDNVVTESHYVAVGYRIIKY